MPNRKETRQETKIRKINLVTQAWKWFLLMIRSYLFHHFVNFYKWWIRVIDHHHWICKNDHHHEFFKDISCMQKGGISCGWGGLQMKIQRYQKEKRWTSSHHYLFSGNLEIGDFLEKILERICLVIAVIFWSVVPFISILGMCATALFLWMVNIEFPLWHRKSLEHDDHGLLVLPGFLEKWY